MTDTRPPRQPGRAFLATQEQNQDLLDELLWLAHDAQDRLPLDPLGDRGYTLGQLNTYARAAAIVAARESHEDPALIADRIVHALADSTSDLPSIRDTALAGLPRQTQKPALEWLGRKAFDARHGDIPGIDHDYGMRWGATGNQRISFRRPTSATEGMLYAYDPTWDEYALIARHVPVNVVSSAFVEALRRDEHLPLEDFTHLIRDGLARAQAEKELRTVGIER
jgi:hypothetical protein